VLSSVFGEVIYMHANDPTVVGIDNPWSIPEFSGTAPFDRLCFSDPCKFTAQFALDGEPVWATRWHKEFYEFTKRAQTPLQDRIAEQIAKATDPKSKAGAIVGAIALGDESFRYNGFGPEDVRIFNIVPDLQTIVITKRCMFLDLNANSNCFRAHPMFFSSLQGVIAVVLVDPEQFVAHSDLKAWMKTLEPKDLAGNPATLLYPGDSLFIPAGFVPLWLALPSKPDMLVKHPQLADRGSKAHSAKGGKALLTECLSVAIHLVCEPEGLPGVSDSLRGALASAHLLSAPLFPQRLKKHAGAKEWLSKLSPLQADAPDGSGAGQ